MTDAQSAARPAGSVASTSGAVTLHTLPDRCSVRFTGDIDGDLSPAHLRQLILAVRAAHRPVHVDCSAVTFFGAVGLGLLAALGQAAPGGSLTELTTSPAMRSVLDIYPETTFTGAPGA